ncbi:MAG: hypothetical protein Q9M33_06605 [Robiginitomaculum sp.]|nr:hypothetical protein [Robiginitomaculum sp.]MDQ7078224.1 hypothetical protein [Robiginitomaculum sp.]
MSEAPQRREIFFEFTRMDENLRVCAVDAITGIEIVTILPASTPESQAQKQALKKLLWRLERESEGVEEGADAPHRPPGKYV